MPDFITNVFWRLWEQYGPVPALLFVGVVYHEVRMWRLYRTVFDAKDAEIKRLVGERNRFQEAVLKNRISTGKNNDEEV